MISGEFKHSLDDKNRLRLPPKFKKEFGQEYVITRGNDGCLFIFSSIEISNLLEKTSEIPMFNSALQKPLRMLYSSAYEVTEDGQGRFLLPGSLKDLAGIKKDVVFVGVGSRGELWASERWEEYKKQCEGDFDSVISELGKFGV